MQTAHEESPLTYKQSCMTSTLTATGGAPAAGQEPRELKSSLLTSRASLGVALLEVSGRFKA